MAATEAPAAATEAPVAETSTRGKDGLLRIIYPQGITILNPHLATGIKDQDGGRIFYEPLASFDREGVLVPILAAEIPSVENGGLAADSTSVTWKLRPDVTWHDGKPFTADDVVFTYEYVTNKEAGATTSAKFDQVASVEKIDDLTVKVTFTSSTPLWSVPFTGDQGSIIAKHVFQDYVGAKSNEAPANLAPVGTGAFKIVEFAPGDVIDGNGDGVREKDGVELSILYQTSVSDARQKTQEIVKQSLEKIGFKVELKSVDSTIFFASDPANPDTNSHFFADIQMLNTGSASIDTTAYLKRYVCSAFAQKENNYSGRNIQRYCNPSFDEIYEASKVELDPEKRAEMIRQMNDMLIEDVVFIPICQKMRASAVSNKLVIDRNQHRCFLSQSAGGTPALV